MSLFEALKRMAQGKPPYETNAPSEDGNNDELSSKRDQPIQQAASATGGPKVLPRVMIERSESRIHNGRLDCHGHIRNESAYPVMLDKVRMFGSARELDTTLRPGEARQFLLYNGKAPVATYGQDCDLQYRDMAGDYSVGHHEMDLQQQPDKTYLVRRIKYDGLKDI